MDQKHIKEAKQRALKLLPQLKESAANPASDNRFTVTWRYSAQIGSIEHARPALEKVYGKAYEYNLVTSGDPDGLGDLAMQNEVAVTAHYFLSNVIKHLEAQQ